jgi:hypothetical protein
MILNTPEQIECFIWKTLLQAVKLEQKGFKHSSGRSASSRVKKELNLPTRARLSTVIKAIETKLEGMSC